MKHILLILILILFNHKRGSLPKLKYHSHIVGYVSFMNVVYYVFCHRKLVWDFLDPHFSKTFIRTINVAITTPLMVLAFVSRMPRDKMKAVTYIVKWATLSTLLEWVALKVNMIIYRYGWTIYWTWLLYLKMYLYSYLYSKNKGLVWVLTIFSTLFFGSVFNIPFFERLKAKSLRLAGNFAHVQY
ncbi:MULTISPECIES: hypothetical protein [Bacillaceae]|uniref:Acyltransferase 3 domain-containing protein n=1 Tax=Evansella alkalicola TaxID=745819 RepID=A0ABS6JUE9_9BACI|nr:MULTISPECIES: hypothetical protein [Bacillaceae]MBU9721711.1 hypothetical protein [Bacillus alkalicola]